jgi:hypothetical protein
MRFFSLEGNEDDRAGRFDKTPESRAAHGGLAQDRQPWIASGRKPAQYSRAI